MGSLTLRRLIVWVVGLGLGFVIAAAFVVAVLPYLAPSHAGQPISIETYGIQYFFWTAFPLGLVFVVWLDKFLDARILPD